jgi:hypothetical protein
MHEVSFWISFGFPSLNRAHVLDSPCFAQPLKRLIDVPEVMTGSNG